MGNIIQFNNLDFGSTGNRIRNEKIDTTEFDIIRNVDARDFKNLALGDETINNHIGSGSYIDAMCAYKHYFDILTPIKNGATSLYLLNNVFKTKNGEYSTEYTNVYIKKSEYDAGNISGLTRADYIHTPYIYKVNELAMDENTGDGSTFNTVLAEIYQNIIAIAEAGYCGFYLSWIYKAHHKHNNGKEIYYTNTCLDHPEVIFIYE